MFKDIKSELDKYEKLIVDNETVSAMQISEEVKTAVLNEVLTKCNECKSRIIKYIEDLPLPEINKTKTDTETIITSVTTPTNPETSTAPTEPNEYKYQKWKAEVGDKVNAIYDRSLNYLESKEILREIYKYMTNVYGVCWQQDQKEWFSQHGYKPKTTEIIFNNEQYKSIFDSVLDDKYVKAFEEHPERYSFIEIMHPLVEKYNDKSSGGSATSRKIYSYMSRKHNVNWEDLSRSYKVRLKSKGEVKKSDLLYYNHKLFEKFRISVYEMMNGEAA